MSLCANCKLRPGTQKYGESATMIVRGFYEMWCEICVLEKQIEHAEGRAALLPELRARLASARASLTPPESSLNLSPSTRRRAGE